MATQFLLQQYFSPFTLVTRLQPTQSNPVAQTRSSSCKWNVSSSVYLQEIVVGIFWRATELETTHSYGNLALTIVCSDGNQGKEKDGPPEGLHFMAVFQGIFLEMAFYCLDFWWGPLQFIGPFLHNQLRRSMQNYLQIWANKMSGGILWRAFVFDSFTASSRGWLYGWGGPVGMHWSLKIPSLGTF